ncbi:MAG: DNA-methyltransferase, partial [Parcubacteria group bacterium GW2011_GWA1_43_27]
RNTFIYLDPPYFKKGAMLYLNAYKVADHKNLANLLNNNSKRHWVLTYDWIKQILALYPDRFRRRLDLKYRVRDSHKVRNAREVMILSDSVANIVS